ERRDLLVPASVATILNVQIGAVDPAVLAQLLQPNPHRFGILYVPEDTDAVNRLLRAGYERKQDHARCRHGERKSVEHRPQPHTARGVPMRSRNLAFCSSIVSALPSTVEEKPHCGLRQSWSSGTYFAASSIRRFSSSLLSSAGRLLVTRPRTTRLFPRGTKRSGSNPPERASSYSRKKPSTASSPNNASAALS